MDIYMTVLIDTRKKGDDFQIYQIMTAFTKMKIMLEVVHDN